MSNPSEEKLPAKVGPPVSTGAGVPARARERRDFFGEAVREMLGPFAHLLERRINPWLEALEQLPLEAERLANSNFGLRDQPRAGGAGGVVKSLPVLREAGRYLRPPGAMAPGQFESVCSRCGKCVEACPVQAIVLDPNGLVADGFPYVVAEMQPCVVCESLACMKSCPTGALKLVDRLAIDMGTAAVDLRQCLRDRGEPCTLCLDVCPIDGKGEGELAALFISAESGQVRVRKNVCAGCGMCESRCPTEPRAIRVVPYAAGVDPILA